MQKMISVCLLLALFPGAAHGTAIQGWRTDGTGRYPQATPPTRWSTDENIAWATPMPAWSNSTPVITGDRLFICAEPSELLCLDLKEGGILWQRSNGLDQLEDAGGGMPRSHGANGYSSPTPVTDGRHVFVLYGNGVVASYDFEGERRWITRVGEPSHDWGHSASPALTDGVLVCLVKDSLVGLHATTGKEKWRVDAESRWGSPVVAAIGSAAVLVTPNGRIVQAANGRVLDESLPRLEYASPVVDGEIVYCIEKKSSAYRLPRSQRGKPKRLWTQRIKGRRHYASPLIDNGLLYTISDDEYLTVMDASTGEIAFDRKFEVGGGQNSAYPSLALGGRHVFLGFEAGTTIVIEPGQTYREVARNRLEKYRSSPVFLEDRMYLRTMGHLYCIAAPDAVTLPTR